MVEEGVRAISGRSMSQAGKYGTRSHWSFTDNNSSASLKSQGRTSTVSLSEEPPEPELDGNDSDSTVSSDDDFYDEDRRHTKVDCSAWVVDQHALGLHARLMYSHLEYKFGSHAEPPVGRESAEMAINSFNTAFQNFNGEFQVNCEHFSQLRSEKTMPGAETLAIEVFGADCNSSISPEDHELDPEPVLLLQPEKRPISTVRSARYWYSRVELARASKVEGVHYGLGIQDTFKKMKRGLSGFVNGSKVSALPDTGASQSTVTLAYVKHNNLQVMPSQTSFTLGNNATTKSIGTTEILWAFAECPKKKMKILCLVLPHCIYDIILGREFLAATETMLRKNRSRITQCLPTFSRIFHLGSLGDNYQFLRGKLGDFSGFDVLAVPDTGAGCNVLRKSYAQQLGLDIHSDPCHRNDIVFADGSTEETVGQVYCRWTFNSGEYVAMTFEVLDVCCNDIIIGEEFLWEHEVFDRHASSIVMIEGENESLELAPFDFAHSWQSKMSAKLGFKPRRQGQRTEDLDTIRQDEARRRNVYNLSTDFGRNARLIDHELEAQRRAAYDELLHNAQVPQDSEPATFGHRLRHGIGRVFRPKDWF